MSRGSRRLNRTESKGDEDLSDQQDSLISVPSREARREKKRKPYLRSD